MNTEKDTDSKCRLDKWLWAARFYKTRSLATDAIDSGKVHFDGDRVKPAKEVRVGSVIRIRNKDFEIEVTVTGLSIQRRGAPEAALLYSETAESLAKRQEATITRQADHGKRESGAGRPTKRQQRDIKRFTGIGN
ncbi:MAG: S4 domain-containing protein [Pseudomonadota bacterium]